MIAQEAAHDASKFCFHVSESSPAFDVDVLTSNHAAQSGHHELRECHGNFSNSALNMVL